MGEDTVISNMPRNRAERRAKRFKHKPPKQSLLAKLKPRKGMLKFI